MWNDNSNCSDVVSLTVNARTEHAVLAILLGHTSVSPFARQVVSARSESRLVVQDR